MIPAIRNCRCLWAAVFGVVVGGMALLTGCATHGSLPTQPVVSVELTPLPEMVAPRSAWALAEAYAAAAPRREIVVGSGGSMLPLYRDRTVLVIESMPMAELRRGMTVVFIGDTHRPVAHTLVQKTPRGWIAMGMGNTEPDRTPVQHRNYIGTVVRAFTPNPELASETVGVPAVVSAERIVLVASTRR